MQVVATAGHVDHGKSALVRALTGMEPDRLEEERRRGLTIDLGFAWTTLPSGGRMAFVDVPGHERFVTTMLAGVGPVPAAMMVVAADEGWMPQSEEHLAALDALGVRYGLLVISRSDLADPTPALRQARARLDGTGLRGVESVAVSSVTGAGLADLTAALDRLAARLPVPAPDAPVRLWVDRVFTVKGSGTVVTGTLAAGTISVGDELVLTPSGRRVRVRALESMKEPADTVRGVSRVAVNLRGVDHDQVRRGMALVAPDRWTMTTCVDVRIGYAEASGRLPRQMILHIGSAAVPVRLRPLGPDTARLTLNARIPLHVGDRALLRDPGRRAVAGVRILDVRPPALVRRGAGAQRARELAAWPDRPGGDVLLRRHGVLREQELALMGCTPPPGAVRLEPDWLADPDHWERLHRRLAEEVDRQAAEQPLAPGITLEAARLRLGLPSRRLVAELVRPPLRLAGGRVHGPRTGPPPQVTEAVERLRAEVAAAPFHAPDAGRLAELGLTGRTLAAAVAAGAVLRLADGVVLPAGSDEQAVRVLAALPQPFTAAQAKQALGTSRRVAIPLLEHLDRRGLTERDGDHRRVRAR
ncbi:selenocysteine-specific translation elongation factor [Thermomonospora cellulosilytica]|uniref:Selenocysteine-specific elongation factor n=1 Tax=Thermomonospora cellulosilytica TaxID=1411118 RepID=A0A7W3RAV5_9ACTN|nr:selenocysteine-specific translation elongation factor [Thermomonospora cellulosilytica]MBA9006089.1 selenocysteine-specific elongation factor [Thermomonospora cellulosilytica]